MVLLAVCILGAVCWRGTEECYSGALVVPAAQLGRPSTVGGSNAFLVPRVLILIPFHSHSGPAGATEEQSTESGLQPSLLLGAIVLIGMKYEL